jgi:rubrerythrin
MTKTLDNLKAAFAGESQANRKYSFAESVDEGFQQVVTFPLLMQTVHALNHLVHHEVKVIIDNLKGYRWEN